MRGLPFNAGEDDVCDFFHRLDVVSCCNNNYYRTPSLFSTYKHPSSATVVEQLRKAYAVVLVVIVIAAVAVLAQQPNDVQVDVIIVRRGGRPTGDAYVLFPNAIQVCKVTEFLLLAFKLVDVNHTVESFIALH